MERGRKAQVSAFIIIGVIILSVVIIYFLSKSETEFFNVQQKKVNPEVQPLYDFVDDCIRETGEAAILLVSSQGGYYALPELSIDLGVPYYIHDKSYVPSLETISEEISRYINYNMDFCIDEFGEFPDFEINSNTIETTTDIKDSEVIISVNYPLSISKGDNRFSVEDFETIIDARLGVLYRTADNIVLNEIDDLQGICIACIDSFAEENNLKIHALDYYDGVIFSIVDETIKINDENIVFNFAKKIEVET